MADSEFTASNVEQQEEWRTIPGFVGFYEAPEKIPRGENHYTRKKARE